MFPDVKVSQNVVHAYFAQCLMFPDVKVSQNVVCAHFAQCWQFTDMYRRSLRMLFVHILHGIISLKFVVIPQMVNCTGVAVVLACKTFSHFQYNY
jgi:hypothetical protein